MIYLFLGQAAAPFNSLYAAALLKSLGWTSSDVLKLFAVRAALIAAPAFLLGIFASWCFALFGNIGEVESALFGFRAGGSVSPVDATGIAMSCIIGGGAVLALWMPAVLVPAVRAALRDPEDFFEEAAC